jgi:3-methyladenine DNA glycosylase AlkC
VRSSVGIQSKTECYRSAAKLNPKGDSNDQSINIIPAWRAAPTSKVIVRLQPALDAERSIKQSGKSALPLPLPKTRKARTT